MTPPLALIIEDEPDLAALFSAAMRNASFETEILADGQIALERLAEITPAIILLDLHLPKISGREILHHIRNDERLTKTRVLITTADTLMAGPLRHQADQVLVKPISFRHLRDTAIRIRRSLM